MLNFIQKRFSSVGTKLWVLFFLIKKNVFSEIVCTIWKFVASCTYFKPLVGLVRSTYPSPENKDQYQVRTGKSLSSGLDTSAWCPAQADFVVVGVLGCDTLLHCSVCAIYIFAVKCGFCRVVSLYVIPVLLSCLQMAWQPSGGYPQGYFFKIYSLTSF